RGNRRPDRRVAARAALKEPPLDEPPRELGEEERPDEKRDVHLPRDSEPDLERVVERKAPQVDRVRAPARVAKPRRLEEPVDASAGARDQDRRRDARDENGPREESRPGIRDEKYESRERRQASDAEQPAGVTGPGDRRRRADEQAEAARQRGEVGEVAVMPANRHRGEEQAGEDPRDDETPESELRPPRPERPQQDD